MRISTATLVWRLVRHEAGLALRIGGVVVLFTMLTIVLGVVGESASEAASSTVGVRTNDRQWIAASSTSDEVFLQLLEDEPTVDGAWFESDVQASVGSRRHPLDVTWLDTVEPRLRTLIKGREPLSSGEAAISSAASAALGAELDDVVDLEGRDVKIVGIFAVPAEERASELVASHLGNELLSPWPDAYFVDAAAPAAVVERLLLRSAGDHLVDDPYISNGQRLIEGARRLSAAIAILGLLVLLGLMTHAGSKRSELLDSLTAAGLTQRRCRRLLQAAALTVIVPAAAAGTLLAVASTNFFKRGLSGLVAQDWRAIVVPEWRLFGIAISIIVGLVAFGSSAIWMPKRRRFSQRHRLDLFWPIYTIAGVFLISIPQSFGFIDLLGAIAGTTLVALSVLLVAGHVERRYPAPIARLLENVGATRSLVVALAVVAAGLGSFVHMSLEWERRSIAEYQQDFQPADTLVLGPVNRTDAEHLVAFYSDLTGKGAIEFLLSEESTEMTRVVSAEMARCLRGSDDFNSAFDQCIPQMEGDTVLSPIGTGLAGTGGSLSQTDSWLASSKTLQTEDEIGLIRIETATDRIIDVTFVAAEPSPILGGVVVEALAPIGYQPSGTGASRLMLEGFSSLEPALQAEFRGEVFRQAGYALVYLPQADDPELFGLQIALLLLTNVLVLALLLAWSTAFLADTPHLAELVAGLRLSRARTVWLSFVVLAPVLVAAAAGLLAGVLAAQGSVAHGIVFDPSPQLVISLAATLAVAFVLSAMVGRRGISRP